MKFKVGDKVFHTLIRKEAVIIAFHPAGKGTIGIKAKGYIHGHRLNYRGGAFLPEDSVDGRWADVNYLRLIEEYKETARESLMF